MDGSGTRVENGPFQMTGNSVNSHMPGPPSCMRTGCRLLPTAPTPIPLLPLRLAQCHLHRKLLPICPDAQSPPQRTPTPLHHTYPSPSPGHPATREGGQTSPLPRGRTREKGKLEGIGGASWGLSLVNISDFSSIFCLIKSQRMFFSSSSFSPPTPFSFNF